MNGSGILASDGNIHKIREASIIMYNMGLYYLTCASFTSETID